MNSDLPDVSNMGRFMAMEVTYPARQVQQQLIFKFLLETMGVQGLF